MKHHNELIIYLVSLYDYREAFCEEGNDDYEFVSGQIDAIKYTLDYNWE